MQVYALTLLHSVVTMFGMWTFAAVGMFEVKKLGAWQVCALCPLSVACAAVHYASALLCFTEQCVGKCIT